MSNLNHRYPHPLHEAARKHHIIKQGWISGVNFHKQRGNKFLMARIWRRIALVKINTPKRKNEIRNERKEFYFILCREIPPELLSIDIFPGLLWGEHRDKCRSPPQTDPKCRAPSSTYWRSIIMINVTYLLRVDPAREKKLDWCSWATKDSFLISFAKYKTLKMLNEIV